MWTARENDLPLCCNLLESENPRIPYDKGVIYGYCTSTTVPEFCPRPRKDTPASQGIDATCLDRLYERIETHIAAGWYPGAALAMARHGMLVAARSFGVARLAGAGQPAIAADQETMWLLYSQTKPITSCAIWYLVEHGVLRFHDAVADYIPNSHGLARGG
jgi:CubicO group peptidase (beta-lactamase class C family)